MAGVFSDYCPFELHDVDEIIIDLHKLVVGVNKSCFFIFLWLFLKVTAPPTEAVTLEA